MNNDELGLLEGGKYISLATLKRSGDFVRTPVWFAQQDGSYYVFTASDTGKAKRLRNFSEVKIATCDYPGNLKGKDFDTKAYMVETQEEADVAYQSIKKKYGLEMTLINFLSWVTRSLSRRVFIRIVPPSDT